MALEESEVTHFFVCFAVDVPFVEVEHPVAINVSDVPSQNLGKFLEMNKKKLI